MADRDRPIHRLQRVHVEHDGGSGQPAVSVAVGHVEPGRRPHRPRQRLGPNEGTQEVLDRLRLGDGGRSVVHPLHVHAPQATHAAPGDARWARSYGTCAHPLIFGCRHLEQVLREFVERDEFATITKIGTGLSDAGWREMYERAQALMVEQRPAHVSSILVPDVWLRPQVVVVVLADEITPSPRHTCGKVGDQPGLALRFPRIVSFRGEDKRPKHTTIVSEILEMHRRQRAR